jgi:hypothetical protein
MSLRLVNLTEHDIVVLRPDGQVVIPPSGMVARVATSQREVARVTADGMDIPVVATVFGEVTGLPGPEPGVLYIASTLVAQAAARAGRRDVVAPDTGPESVVRGPDGRPTAVRRLQTFAGEVEL